MTPPLHPDERLHRVFRELGMALPRTDDEVARAEHELQAQGIRAPGAIRSPATVLERAQDGRRPSLRAAALLAAAAAAIVVGVLLFSGPGVDARTEIERLWREFPIETRRLEDPQPFLERMDRAIVRATTALVWDGDVPEGHLRVYVRALARRAGMAVEIERDEAAGQDLMQGVRSLATRVGMDVDLELLLARSLAVIRDPARTRDVAAYDAELAGWVGRLVDRALGAGAREPAFRTMAFETQLRRVGLARDHRPDEARATSLLAEAGPLAARLDDDAESKYLQTVISTGRFFATKPADYDALEPYVDRLVASKKRLDQARAKVNSAFRDSRYQEGDGINTRGALRYEAYRRFERPADLAAAGADFERALALRRTHPDLVHSAEGIAWAEHNLGMVRLEQSRLEEARAHLARAVAFKRQDQRDPFTSITGLGLVDLLEGDAKAAASRFEEAASHVPATGDLRTRLALHLHLEVAYTVLGDPRAAVERAALDKLLAADTADGHLQEFVEGLRRRARAWRRDPQPGSVRVAVLPILAPGFNH